MYDLLFALVIFLVLIFYLLISLNNHINAVSEEKTLIKMESNLFNSSNILTLTTGNPSNWQNLDLNQINSIGLVNEKRVLNQSKLNKLASMDYNKSKEKMLIPQYDYYLKIEQDFQTVFEKGVTITNPKYSISTQRIIELNGKPAKLNLTLFKS